MSSIRLGHTSYVVLGSISLRGASTSYDLKRFVEATLGHFWSFPHSQLYAEPDRLAHAGLLSEHREQNGRRRRIYTITAAGREALEAWLGEPTPDNAEIRDPGLLKLFFSELATEDDFRSLAREQAAIHRSLLSRYESLWQRYGERREYAHRNLPLRWGLRMERALVDFWQELGDERLPTAAPPTRKSTRR